MIANTAKAKAAQSMTRLSLQRSLLWSVLIGLVMLPRLLNLDTFVGPDELAELGRDNNFAQALARGDLAGTLVGDGKPSVTLMWVNTLGITGKWLWLQFTGAASSFIEVVAPDRPFALWPERRFFLALASGLQLLAAWPLLRLIWNERVATLAVGLMAVEPLFLAFTRMIRGDSLLAGFMILAILGALAFLKTGQRRYNWFAGVMTGLALLTKLSGGVVVLMIVPLYALIALRNCLKSSESWSASLALDVPGKASLALQLFRQLLRRQNANQQPGQANDIRTSPSHLLTSSSPYPLTPPRAEPRYEASPPPSQGWRWFTGATIAWGIAAAIIFFGLWPAWWLRPVDTFNLLWDKTVFHTVEATTQQAATYFWGTVHPLGPGPWFYPVLAALRLTPWLLLGSLIAVGRCLWQAAHWRRATFDLNTLALLFYAAAYWIVITLPGQKIDRFFLPLIPVLAILAALEIANAAHWLSHATEPKAPYGRNTQHATRNTFHVSRFTPLWAALLILGLVWYIGRYHPLYSTYFNPLGGGPQFRQWALPVGHGEGVDAALKHLSTLPGVRDKTVVCGTNFPRCQPFFAGPLRPQADLRSAQWFQADYVLWHIDEQQLDLFPASVLAYLRRQPPIYVAGYHGIDYTWLYALPRPAFLTSGSKLEGVATLFGYDAGDQSLTELSPGDPLRLHLYWQNEGQASQQRLWWRVVDEQGYIWAEALAQPLPSFELEAPQEGAVVEGETLLTLPPDMPPGAYMLQAGSANERGDVGQFMLPPEGNLVTVTGPPLGPSEPGQVLNHLLTPALRLRGYDLSAAEVTPGETVWLALYWQTTASLQRDYLITLRMLDETEQEVAAWSGQPVYNSFPTRQWPAQADVRDPWRLTLPTDLSPGLYHLTVELGDAGAAAPERVSLGPIRLVERRVTFDVPPMQFQAKQAFGQIAALLGYDLAGDLSPTGAHVAVTLYWQALSPGPAQPYTVNLRLVDTQGQVLVEQTAEPAAGAAPVTEWQAGEIVTDRHELNITGSEPASVNLELRLLDAAGQPAPLSNGSEALVIPEVQQKVMWRTSAP